MNPNYPIAGINMSNSKIVNTFNESRDEFKPYGLTCELWTPNLMRKPDRHNEIEINYFTGGSMTYLIHGRQINIPAKRLAVFWGLIPHQIIRYEGEAPYYVCTIPFSLFLAWRLPVSFVDRVLKGEILMAASEKSCLHDEYMLKNWLQDLYNTDAVDVALLEIRARLSRLAINNMPPVNNDHAYIKAIEASQVVKIAVYIAQNYSTPIKASDIGEAVGLHPDYANFIFKKAFGYTLRDCIMEERISHAQRKLLTTDTSITEIAFECGFNSISRFNASFRKINQCTPREFRKAGKRQL